MITVIKTRFNNLGSVCNMLGKLGAQVQVTEDANEVKKAEKIILPGIGSFDAVMEQLEMLEMPSALNHAVLERKVPLLGICVGMQVLAHSSEEGKRKGLGWIPTQVVKFQPTSKSQDLRYPHMGWNSVLAPPYTTLFQGKTDWRFYFVHSYHFPDTSSTERIYIGAKTEYGYSFLSAVQKDNIFGVQFHPEKSHRYGMALMSNFLSV